MSKSQLTNQTIYKLTPLENQTHKKCNGYVSEAEAKDKGISLVGKSLASISDIKKDDVWGECDIKLEEGVFSYDWDKERYIQVV